MKARNKLSPSRKTKRSKSPSKSNRPPIGTEVRRQRSPSPKKRCQSNCPTSKQVKGERASTQRKKSPYVGDLDDPNLPDYERDNIHLKFGYRIFHNRYSDCVRSIFSIHTETVNIWTHLIAALIFLSLIPYIAISLKPTSLHETPSLVSRWTSDFDHGKFDTLPCDSQTLQYFETKEGECPFRASDLLADILETDRLLDWHHMVGSRT